jgi:tRNA/tmRNA/rRNA uracil-C5-methylase (TrmA/RlmC/RlmD family)
MNDIRAHDRKLLIRELTNVGSLIATAAIVFLGFKFPWAFLALGFVYWYAVAAAKDKEFTSAKIKTLWTDCEDRLKRLKKAIKENQKREIVSVSELPTAIEQVSENLYAALRRADIVTTEINKSEGWLIHRNSHPNQATQISDPQAQELYRLADKNLVEYRTAYESVMATVQRTEAQAAVFVTTLDSLRLRILGQRLSPNKTEMESGDFMQIMNEAKLQLAAIDKALDELDLQPYPKMIAVAPDSPLNQTPPPLPDEARIENKQ